jgi:hypothetical protein
MGDWDGLCGCRKPNKPMKRTDSPVMHLSNHPPPQESPRFTSHGLPGGFPSHNAQLVAFHRSLYEHSLLSFAATPPPASPPPCLESEAAKSHCTFWCAIRRSRWGARTALPAGSASYSEWTLTVILPSPFSASLAASLALSISVMVMPSPSVPGATRSDHQTNKLYLNQRRRSRAGR